MNGISACMHASVGNAWDEILHISTHSTLISLSSNEFECIFNFNCSAQTTKDSTGNRKRGVGRMLKCFSLGKIKWKLICEFFLSLYSFFFIASLVFNQHWQKRRFTFFRNFLRLGAIILQPGGVCCRLSSARLALSAPFSSDNDNDDGRGIMGERKWMEKRWRWAEKEEWRGINYFTVECLRRRRHLRQRWSLISIFFDC